MISCYQIEGQKLRLKLFVQPKSSKTTWDAIIERDNAVWMRLKISSPPVDGAANKEVIKFVAKEFKVAKSKVRIVRGEKSRFKTLELETYDSEKLQAFENKCRPA